MELHMKEAARFQDIQAEFSGEYPYLKMNFFKTTGEKIATYENMRSFYRTAERNDIGIPMNKKITQVIGELEKLLQVKVTMLRKSGSLWIETSLTTEWTLEQQNREGKSLS